MAVKLGTLGQITRDFNDSMNAILGKVPENKPFGKPSVQSLFNADVGGSTSLQPEKFLGNSRNKNAVKYGFAAVNLDQLNAKSIAEEVYYLDIPPQHIEQKEIFANNITATRRGVVVESEGIVFRDIIIEGTTGIFPGERGDANVPRPPPTSKVFEQGPQGPRGITDKGQSLKAGVSTISGYQEFLMLRQFFYKYASDKIRESGNKFLIFINEKDNQTLIVEPMEFTMTRSSNSPMTYNYRIVLKGIGDLGAGISSRVVGRDPGDDPVGFLQKAANFSSNVSATIATFRAVLNTQLRLIRRVSQLANNTINGPLRQIEFATRDLKDGVTEVISLPEILVRNVTQSTLNARENLHQFADLLLGDDIFSPKPRPGEPISPLAAASRIEAAQRLESNRLLLERVENDARVPLPRSFLESSKKDLRELADGLSDFLGMSDPTYNQLVGRTSTIQTDPTKVVSNEEFITLGALISVSEIMNTALASNVAFQVDAEVEFDKIASLFETADTVDGQRIQVNRPQFVKEIEIERGDTLERIAQRELGSAEKWVDIVVLNRLKFPYIAESRKSGVKQVGDKLLVGTV